MNDFKELSPDALRAGRADALDDAVAAALAAHPLDGVETEYPHYRGTVEGPEAPPRPSETHPVFYGCFDWHSAVHSHWALVRALRLAPDHPNEAEIAAGVDERLTPENVAREVDYLDENPGFEEPYGWSWLLRLAAELDLWDDPRADAWRETLRPLEDRISRGTRESFLGVDRPQRVGTHGNTAFALAGVLDYARIVGDAALEREAEAAARRLYADDTAAVVGAEPVGWDFLSPALVEADLMRRVLGPDPFAAWLGRFLPDLSAPPHDALLAPVDVEPEEGDGAAIHLIGLNVSRAWCLAGLSDALADRTGPVAARLREPLDAAARRHAEAGAADVRTDDYAGSHWLSSFALYLLTRNEAGIAPGAA
ncbi:MULTISPECIES: DUF2891 domain-containing protein [unclassified Halorubrum]|uniref:DUF2891 domain-containing protein n=1 Tax=unclassified Halorubrum TaxID=2642239 RepID=UPI0010F46B24|nr:MULTISPECIES: DUF2891 domain-containing protein [unclassified Halorubrum]TKX45391.1 DUF2891 domain-containing protein [Halorubrum sp. ARQ200]TKX51436.1 DUF2891 domain-containing protein [Halorubrum sp. ASP121]